eukprot:scaffold230623_cov57-Attheya_sp.AAC.4
MNDVDLDELMPILDPYPVPIAVTISIAKTPGQPLGITMKNINHTTVTVTGISPDSFVKGTSIQVGTEILAINGESTYNARESSQIIRRSAFLELTTFDETASRSPFCYVEVAPTSKINPGISFDSCCDRTMVMVADIFLSDPSRTRLRVGDIVLAVNGVPVWKPEEADSEQLKAVCNSKSLVLYCVHMDALRDFFSKKANAMRNKHIDRKVPKIIKKGNGHYMITENNCICTAKVNLKTQLLDDETEVQYRIKNIPVHGGTSRIEKKISYSEAWDYAIKKSEDDIPTYIVPSAPPPPAGFGSLEACAIYPLATASQFQTNRIDTVFAFIALSGCVEEDRLQLHHLKLKIFERVSDYSITKSEDEEIPVHISPSAPSPPTELSTMEAYAIYLSACNLISSKTTR